MSVAQSRLKSAKISAKSYALLTLKTVSPEPILKLILQVNVNAAIAVEGGVNGCLSLNSDVHTKPVTSRVPAHAGTHSTMWPIPVAAG